MSPLDRLMQRIYPRPVIAVGEHTAVMHKAPLFKHDDGEVFAGLPDVYVRDTSEENPRMLALYFGGWAHWKETSPGIWV